MKFFLGTHQPHWLADEKFTGVPLFISRRRLDRYKTRIPAVTSFALDSGGFTELQIHGRWSIGEPEYIDRARALKRSYPWALLWVAPQDWMCEPLVISGGSAERGVTFAGTGLSVEEHQKRTVSNFIRLRRALGSLVIPVLQGWSLADYWRCLELYKDSGVSLLDEPVVGVGTVCRRQSTAEGSLIMATLAAEKLSLHGFGFKKQGLSRCGDLLTSADSMAWSDAGRRGVGILGHDQPGPGRPRGHKNCANCAEYALQWREELLAQLQPSGSA